MGRIAPSPVAVFCPLVVPVVIIVLFLIVALQTSLLMLLLTFLLVCFASLGGQINKGFLGDILPVQCALCCMCGISNGACYESRFAVLFVGFQ